ncbi:hypothetical protein K1719_006445 [Acacia pycnantha]|nr:hypothetical protein K1719_006445 [Acacia pycnantha]
MGDGVSSCYLAPIHERGHWTLCVVCPRKNSCYWFDSVDGNPTEDIKNMFADGLKTYRELINAKEQGGPKWFKPTCHQQPVSTEISTIRAAVALADSDGPPCLVSLAGNFGRPRI